MTQRDPPHDVARILAVADTLDPHLNKWLEITNADKLLAAQALRIEASRRLKAAAPDRPMRPEPS